MDSVRSLKRERRVGTELCIIYNKDSGLSLRTSGEQGRTALQTAEQASTTVSNLLNKNVVSHLYHVPDYSVKIFYHKDLCNIHQQQIRKSRRDES